MCLFLYDDDPEPEERIPARPLYVPARPGATGVVVRLFRTPLGARTAVGFTAPDRLVATLGAEQTWIRLSGSALRAMAEPLGASLLTVDPTFTAPAAAPEPVPEPVPLPVGEPLPSVTGTGSVAAVVVAPVAGTA
ncbi:SAV_915 family protein [Streptomyces sp. NPDC058611]|uniref:SAV_915 family protein n=1 Tax=unclassified Streptomyces TaxID=2593676 RepID=UPI00364E93D2